jgi:class III poly(R)-hydroxyalkanoic acid synthase PhaE subunit
MTEETKNKDIPLSQWFEWQKSVWDTWMSTAGKGMNSPESMWSNQISFDIYKDIYETWIKSFVNPLAANGNHGGLGADVFKKLVDASNTYVSLLGLWGQTLTQLQNIPVGTTLTSEKIGELYQQWNENYESLMTSLWGTSSGIDMKETIKAYQDTTAFTNQYASKFWETIRKSSSQLPDIFTRMAKGESGANSELAGFLQKNYEETLGKILRAPSLGYFREFNDKLNRVIDTYIHYSIAMAEYFVPFYQAGQTAGKELFNHITKYRGQEITSDTLKEFYRLWWTVNEDTYYEMFQSEEFTKLLGEVLQHGLFFRKYVDELTDELVKFTSLPSKKDMDDLYRSIHELKKEVRLQKKKINELEKQSIQQASE